MPGGKTVFYAGNWAGLNFAAASDGTNGTTDGTKVTTGSPETLQIQFRDHSQEVLLFFRVSFCAFPDELAGLNFDAVEKAAVQIIAHERFVQKIPWKTWLNPADCVQLRELLRVQRPFDTVQVILQL